MNTRIFSAALTCAAFLALPAYAVDIRPEIRQPLNEAVKLSREIHPDKAAIVEKLKIAQAVPNQTHDERIAEFGARSFITNHGVVLGPQPDRFDPLAPISPGGPTQGP